MSDPQKMTARELLAMLRSGQHNTYLMALGGVQHDARCLAAADLIDALKAENERLRDEHDTMLGLLMEARSYVAERDELRAKVQQLRAVIDGPTATDATTRTADNGAAP